MFSLGGGGSKGGRFQNSNFASEHRRKQFKNDRRQDVLATQLKNFIWANTNLVDRDTLGRLNVGEEDAVDEALHQIHWRSLTNGPTPLSKGWRSDQKQKELSEGHYS